MTTLKVADLINRSGKEVGNFIDGVATLATKLLKIVEEKVIAEED